MQICQNRSEQCGLLVNMVSPHIKKIANSRSKKTSFKFSNIDLK